MAIRCIYIVALVLSTALGAPKKSNTVNLEKISRKGGDRLAGLYVKDGETGDLRFLTGGSNAGTTNAINQFITNGQNLLEQLRPNTGNTNVGLGNLNTGGLGTLGNLNTGGLGTLGTLGSSSSLGSFGSSGTNGVTPIIVNLGNTGSSSSSSLQGIASQTSPIGDVLPQIIAQAVFNQRRRPVNRRRPANGQGQIFVIRPNV